MWRCSARPDQTFSRDFTFERNTEGILQQHQEYSVLAMYYVYRSSTQNVLDIHLFIQSVIPSFLPSFIHSFILKSVLWQVHRLFQSEFSTDRNLVLFE